MLFLKCVDSTLSLFAFACAIVGLTNIDRHRLIGEVATEYDVKARHQTTGEIVTEEDRGEQHNKKKTCVRLHKLQWVDGPLPRVFFILPLRAFAFIGGWEAMC